MKAPPLPQAFRRAQGGDCGLSERHGTVAARSFSAWEKTLTAGIGECTLGYNQRRAVLEIHPLDDYYFAAAVDM